MKYKHIFEEKWEKEGKIKNQEKIIDKVEEQNKEYYHQNWHEHDAIFKTVLDKKEETVKFINKTLKLNIKKEEIEKYNSSFISKTFQNQEADIVYKIKDKNIFFLIEHQSKIDYSMPFRLLEYEVAIIRSAVDKSKIKNKSYKIPLVMPIVLYTGKQKWNANKYLEKSQEKIQGLNIKIGNYSLVDINNYTEKELLEDNTFISKMMLIEKSKNTEEIAETLEKIINKTQKEDKELLKSIIEIFLEEKIGIQKSTELIRKLESESDSMLAIVDMIRKENQMYIDMGRKEGKKEGKKLGKIEGKREGEKTGKMQKLKEIVLNMIEENLSNEIIMKVTGISPKEIEKIKNSKNKIKA